MAKFIVPFLLAALAVVGGGCSYVDKLTGQTDDTVLPGQREDAVPGRASFPDKDATPQPSSPQTADGTAQQQPSPCPVDDPECTPPPSDGTFGDGQ